MTEVEDGSTRDCKERQGIGAEVEAGHRPDSRPKVNEALAILQYTHKRSAHPIELLLRSAIANAEQKAQAENIAVDVDDLWVKECFVGKGVTKNRRRVRPAPMGRAYRERRHYSHITIRVSSERREATGKTPKVRDKEVRDGKAGDTKPENTDTASS